MGKLARIFLAFFILNTVIITHELGHFAAGEALGIEADRISLGFGPALVRWEVRKGLEAQVAAVPLGGYVSFSEAGSKELSGRPLWQKVFVSGAGVAVNWFSPFFILLALSPLYRRHRSDAARTYPKTVFRPDTLAWLRQHRYLFIPFIGDMICMFRDLVLPLPVSGSVPEEYAWKYNDLAKMIGFFNLMPFPFLDGGSIFTSIILSILLSVSLGGIVAIAILFVCTLIALMYFFTIPGRHPYYYRWLL